MGHHCVAALGNAAAAVPEEVMLDRELTRTGSTLSSKLSSRSSALSSKLSTRSSAPRYAASPPTAEGAELDMRRLPTIDNCCSLRHAACSTEQS